MSSDEKPARSRRERWAARVGSTLLWPVAKARPASDWAKMQRQLGAVADESEDAGPRGNPFVAAAAAVPNEEKRAAGAPSVQASDAEVVSLASVSADVARDEREARASDVAPADPSLRTREPAGVSAPSAATVLEASAASEGGAERVASAASRGGAPEAPRRWRVPALAPTTLLAVLVVAALLAWLGAWLRPSPPSPGPEPAPAGISTDEIC